MKKREQVQKELKALIKKTEDFLDNEINVPQFQTFAPTIQQLLKEQYGIMVSYRQVLVLRLHYGFKEDK